jgi:hypothetical protein
LTSACESSAGLPPPHRRWPWWPALGGRGVWLLVVVGFLVVASSPANNTEVRSGAYLPPPLAILGGCEVVICSYVDSSRPDPWQRVASALFAPFPPCFSYLKESGFMPGKKVTLVSWRDIGCSPVRRSDDPPWWSRGGSCESGYLLQ